MIIYLLLPKLSPETPVFCLNFECFFPPLPYSPFIILSFFLTSAIRILSGRALVKINCILFLLFKNGLLEFAPFLIPGNILHLSLFTEFNTLTLMDINKLQTGIFMYKFINKLLPRVFSTYFLAVHNIHGHSTRSSNNLHVPFTRTSYSMNTLRFHGPRLWNDISRAVKEVRDSC